MANNQNGNLFGLDILSLVSLFLGYQNLIENREQSAHNDVSAANDKQAAYLLSEFSRQIDEQNQKLDEILQLLKQIRGE